MTSPGATWLRSRFAAPYLRGDQIEEQLIYPVTTGSTEHPGGYEAAIEEFYEQAAARLMAHLAAGRDVALWPGGERDSLRTWTRRAFIAAAGDHYICLF